jgi:rhodanese-related sulfurtransferase
VVDVHRPASRQEVERLLRDGAQVVEVLQRSEYDERHLPGAVSIPLWELAERAPKELDPSRPVVVYCYDELCDLSPRAASRLDSMGFAEVYDYVASKVDWFANGLPGEGEEMDLPRIGALADPEVPTCHLDERAAVVRERVGDAEVCVVVDADRVVLGVVRTDALDAEGSVEQLMREGPSTYRPDVSASEMAEELRKRPGPRVLVTNGDGTLVGVARSEDVERAASAGAGVGAGQRR